MSICCVQTHLDLLFNWGVAGNGSWVSGKWDDFPGWGGIDGGPRRMEAHYLLHFAVLAFAMDLVPVLSPCRGYEACPSA